MSSLGKILVTGADGFIGSHLVEALVRRGHDVRALVLYNSFNSWGWLDHAEADVKPGLEVVAGDVRDATAVRTAMQGCATVLHLAALISIPYSYQAAASFVATNVTGTLNILEAARDLGAARTVVTSTSEVYGTAQRVPMAEDHPLNGQSPYAASKIGADALALAFHRSFAVPVSVLRPFNTYGPRQSARAVIPTVITQILAGARRIKLGALHPTRDFTFVADTATGFIALAEAMAKSDAAVGEVVNLGAGFDISIGDTAALVAEVMGQAVEIDADPQRLRPAASEVERLQADTAKARRLLNWSPAFAGRQGLRRGIELTAQWFARPEVRALYKAGQYNI
ncbi:MAG: NAD-dependent 4,6-dehydratase LegB [Rhodospirillaceae bacterium]|nr:NAD-dependent 4,6-dehydratase LegB [Rhodospirillaceae bacterium]